MFFKCTLFLLYFIVSINCEDAIERYDGYKVYRLIAKNKDQIEFLANLNEIIADLDFWSDVNLLERPVDIMVAPKDQTAFLDTVTKQGIDFEVFIENVQSLIENEKTIKTGTSGMNWSSFHSLESIYSWLEDLAKKSSLVTLLKIGQTHENRDIKGIKISFGSGKRAVFIEGGIHAREWISPATTTFIIDQLVNRNDTIFSKMAQNFDWYIFPVVNPDGYEHSFNSTRLWRKTRTRHSNCYGVDLNRNWGYQWGSAGSSKYECSERFRGLKPFSEKETIALSEFIKTIGSKLDIFLSFHAYGQIFLMPYGYTAQHLDNYDEVLQIGNAAVKAISKRYNTRYIVGSIAEILYFASGGSMDWVKQTFKPPIAFTYELRDRGRFGFVLPTSAIIPNCLEVMDSLEAILQEGEKIGYFKFS